MAPKKATGAAKPKSSTVPQHASYQDMIKDAILNLKERNGSSRQAIKKYIKANNNLGTTTDAAFNNHINKALTTGEKNGAFDRPKGPSGPVKLKKAAAKPAAKEAKAEKPKKKAAAAKPKAAAGEKKPKAAVKKAAPAKPKANAGKSRAKATKTEEKPAALAKTKTGRVTKKAAPAKKAATAKKPAPAKKAAPKKSTKKETAA